MSTTELDRSMLDGKDREELHAIAAAVGVKAPTRMRKAELVAVLAVEHRTIELSSAHAAPDGGAHLGIGCAIANVGYRGERPSSSATRSNPVVRDTGAWNPERRTGAAESLQCSCLPGVRQAPGRPDA